MLHCFLPLLFSISFYDTNTMKNVTHLIQKKRISQDCGTDFPDPGNGKLVLAVQHYANTLRPH